MGLVKVMSLTIKCLEHTSGFQFKFLKNMDITIRL